MKKYTVIFLFLLFISCGKGNSLSPYTMKYENGFEKYIILNDLVTFSIPDNIDFFDNCNPENEYLSDSSKINIESYAIHQSEIEYMNPSTFNSNFLKLMKKENYVLNKNLISSLIQENKSGTLLCYGQRDYSVSDTYSFFKYNEKVIGESQWYSSKLDENFICPLIEFDLYFVASEYLVYVKIKYENETDFSICEKYPEYFTKKENGFIWKSEEARNSFFKNILLASKKTNAVVLNNFVEIYKSILETIQIK